MLLVPSQVLKEKERDRILKLDFKVVHICDHDS